MKRLPLISIGFAFLLSLACVFNTSTPGISKSGDLIQDPASGMDSLSHYRSSLTIERQVSSTDQKEQYSLSVWPSDKALFESVDTFNTDHQEIQFVMGKVGDAGYLMDASNTGCRTFWKDSNVQADTNDLVFDLYPVHSGNPGSDETINGIAAHTYQLDSSSMGIEGTQATGKIWIAASGGYLLKYHLELTGGPAISDTDVNAKETIDYEVSEVNNGSPVTYPGDCQPVLLDIPATSDVQGLVRLPGRVSFSSASSAVQVKSFYEKYFSGQGWDEIDDVTPRQNETDIDFVQISTNRFATVFLKTNGSQTDVDIRVAGPSSPSTPSSATPVGTPSGNTSTSLDERITSALSKAIGKEKTPSVFPSYSLTMQETLPSASGNSVNSLQAEAQGNNIHYVLTQNGQKSDVLLANGKVYSMISGKPQPGDVMLKLGWTTWQLDPGILLATSVAANPQLQGTETLEGRTADKIAIDSTTSSSGIPDTTMGLLPYVVTKMQGTIWIDQETSGLLKFDLTFEADVKKPGDTKSSGHGKGESHIAFTKIGQVKVNLPQ